MSFENMFSLAGLVAIVGWSMLLFSPFIPRLSDLIAGVVMPLVLCAGYLFLLILPEASSSGGYRSLADVMALFSHEQAMLAGWVHFLAFDLFIGGWACRKARTEGVNFLLVAPCLPLIFLFGPVGLLAFQVIRAFRGGLHG